MGSGRWSATTYDDRAAAKAAAGKDTFDYSVAALRSGHLRVHQTLDPMGLIARESRDSAEHPDSNAILISLDVTGSMGRVVRGIHQDLRNGRAVARARGTNAECPRAVHAGASDGGCHRLHPEVRQLSRHPVGRWCGAATHWQPVHSELDHPGAHARRPLLHHPFDDAQERGGDVVLDRVCWGPRASAREQRVRGRRSGAHG